jgi:alkyldihydroxyacetonephosphate synthase
MAEAEHAPATPTPVRDQRFWGWGSPAYAQEPPAHAVAFIAGEVGIDATATAPVALEEVRLGEPALPDGLRARLEAIVGAGGVRDDREARVLRAAGKGYPDLVRQRAGDARGAPDAVVFPASHEDVRAILAACAEAEVAVVPFGGGTSVVGGVAPERGRFEAVISLDLGRIDQLESVDERSLTAVAGPGMRGPELEAALRARGFTLGHFPQSFEYVTVGGCAATRSAGQASTGYGRIDELVAGIRLAAPTGDLDLAALPASAAGPDLRELVVGSEGTLGVITRVALRVRPAPAARRYEGWMFGSFAAGAEALRELEQSGAAPDVARLSDEQETRMSLAVSGSAGGLKGAALRRYLRLRGVGRRGTGAGALAITGWEGSAAAVSSRRDATVAIIRRHGGVALGQSPGRAWEHGRYHSPYLRDDLLARGVMVETLETATQWSNLFTLYGAVRRALREHAPLVACHISHLYPTGASLYFTFFARQDKEDPVGQWSRVKTAASEAIVSHGGTITHHHAVGRDHARWLDAEAGETGVAALRALKAQLDPVGIMNPGKLLPPEPAAQPAAR